MSLTDKQLMDLVEKILLENLDNDEFGIQELADEIKIDRVHLYKRLKEITGKSPSDFKRDFQMEKAKEWLRDTDLPINEIADKVGFKDHPHFSNTFKRYFGCTPIEFRG